MAGLVGAMVSFEEGHELLHELAGVDVPTKHVERAAEALGREVAEDEKLAVRMSGLQGRDDTPPRRRLVTYGRSKARRTKTLTRRRASSRRASSSGAASSARRARLGDGAIWIGTHRRHFPDAVRDRFHAKQHLSDVSKSMAERTP